MYENLWEQDPTIKRMKLLAKKTGREEGKREGKREGEKEGALKVQRQSVVDIVEMRFPNLTELAIQRVGRMTSLEELRQLMMQVVAAPDETTARRILSPDVA